MTWLKRQWSWLTAFLRLDDKAVCEWAKKGHDYHDYPDDELGEPCHMVPLTCKRCGRQFYM